MNKAIQKNKLHEAFFINYLHIEDKLFQLKISKLRGI